MVTNYYSLESKVMLTSYSSILYCLKLGFSLTGSEKSLKLDQKLLDKKFIRQKDVDKLTSDEKSVHGVLE